MSTEPNANLPRGDRPVAWWRALPVLAIFIVVGFLCASIIPQLGHQRASDRAQCINNLKQIALGLLNYEYKYGEFPPAYTVDADGKPLHSWRTLILPFMEGDGVYKKLDLAKPWDDPANQAASEKPFPAYVCPSFESPPNHTTYLAVIAPGGFFQATESRKLAEITDDPATTLMVIEVDASHSVPWMSPVDADEALILSLTSSETLSHSSEMSAVFVDGRGRFLPTDTDAKKLRAMISIAGGDDALLED